jgi:hypothetical protein
MLQVILYRHGKELRNKVTTRSGKKGRSGWNIHRDAIRKVSPTNFILSTDRKA